MVAGDWADAGFWVSSEPTTHRQRVHSMTDEGVHVGIVDDPNAKPTDEAFRTDARVVMPRRGESMTIRLDADLLQSLRSERGYQPPSTPPSGRI